MEPEGSSPCSQELTTGPHSVLEEFHAYTHILVP
jgi:hypothetical protein